MIKDIHYHPASEKLPSSNPEKEKMDSVQRATSTKSLEEFSKFAKAIPDLKKTNRPLTMPARWRSMKNEAFKIAQMILGGFIAGSIAYLISRWKASKEYLHLRESDWSKLQIETTKERIVYQEQVVQSGRSKNPSEENKYLQELKNKLEKEINDLSSTTSEYAKSRGRQSAKKWFQWVDCLRSLFSSLTLKKPLSAQAMHPLSKIPTFE